mmetsp:Transcript_34339/g.113174  ORF Transcript_34339/g.113174 Transcript_34339/m.113174 type:complete len:218 (+) Transcript_34339:137-790(+)
MRSRPAAPLSEGEGNRSLQLVVVLRIRPSPAASAAVPRRLVELERLRGLPRRRVALRLCPRQRHPAPLIRIPRLGREAEPRRMPPLRRRELRPRLVAPPRQVRLVARVLRVAGLPQQVSVVEDVEPRVEPLRHLEHVASPHPVHARVFGRNHIQVGGRRERGSGARDKGDQQRSQTHSARLQRSGDVVDDQPGVVRRCRDRHAVEDRSQACANSPYS